MDNLGAARAFQILSFSASCGKLLYKIIFWAKFLQILSKFFKICIKMWKIFEINYFWVIFTVILLFTMILTLTTLMIIGRYWRQLKHSRLALRINQLLRDKNCLARLHFFLYLVLGAVFVTIFYFLLGFFGKPAYFVKYSESSLNLIKNSEPFIFIGGLSNIASENLNRILEKNKIFW